MTLIEWCAKTNARTTAALAVLLLSYGAIVFAFAGTLWWFAGL